MKIPSQSFVQGVLKTKGFNIIGVNWVGLMACVINRIRKGEDVIDAIEECAEKFC